MSRLAPERRGWFGATLLRLRSEQGYSIEEAARMLGVSTAALGSYERGSRMPSVHTAANLLRGYGKRIDVVDLDHVDPSEVIISGISEILEMIKNCERR